MTLEEFQVDFSPQSLLLLNILLGFIMFGIALNLKFIDFKRAWLFPKPVLVGFTSQFILLPAVTFLLILIVKPAPEIALGMLLVACCPGGNVSNFMSHLAKANVVLSITLTAIATLAAVFLTPFNFSFWSSMIPGYDATGETVLLKMSEMIQIAVWIIIFPVVVGMLTGRFFPVFTGKINKPVRILSFIFFSGFIVVAIYKNVELFQQQFVFIFALVILHNFLAFLTGFLFSKSLRLQKRDVRAITIETGLQNSGLGLVLIFNFFSGSPEMALVAVTWGLWHLFSGLALAGAWSRRKISEVAVVSAP